MSENEKTTVRERQSSHEVNIGTSQLFESHINAEFDRLMGKVAVEYLNKDLGFRTVQLVEELLNKHGTTIHEIGRNADDLADPLYCFFGDRADVVVDGLLKHMFFVLGSPSEESYTRFDLKYAIRKIKGDAHQNLASVNRRLPSFVSGGGL